MTLNDIVQSAQGGQAVGNLAEKFGLSPDQAQAAVRAMMPAFALGLQKMAERPEAIGGLLSELASGAHAASFAEPGQAADASALGQNVLAQVFGSPDAVDQVVQHVAKASGASPQAIAGMLPAVGSILAGGLAHAMAGQGHSGMLGELANAAMAPGGLKAALSAEASSGGGLGSILSSIFGGAREPVNPQAAALVVGLTTLSTMFVAGVQASQAHQASLAAASQSFVPPPTPPV